MSGHPVGQGQMRIRSLVHTGVQEAPTMPVCIDLQAVGLGSLGAKIFPRLPGLIHFPVGLGHFLPGVLPLLQAAFQRGPVFHETKLKHSLLTLSFLFSLFSFLLLFSQASLLLAQGTALLCFAFLSKPFSLYLHVLFL